MCLQKPVMPCLDYILGSEELRILTNVASTRDESPCYPQTYPLSVNQGFCTSVSFVNAHGD